jgi:nucleotide-binding universal stress UspA family protein
MFNKVLVAVDEQEAGQLASRFAGDLSASFGSAVQIFHPALPQGTRRQRDRQLATEIAAAARLSDADLIVLGIERRTLGRRHVSGSLRQQLAHLTRIPLMAAPAPHAPPRHSVVNVRRLHGERRMLSKRLQHV